VSARSEHGALTAFVAIFSLSLFILIGLVVDGGRQVNLQGAVENDAQQAARVAAGQLSVEALRAGTISVSPQAAISAATDYLRNIGQSGTVSVAGARVTVTTRKTEPTLILSLIGIRRIEASATASALDVGGVTRADP